MCLRGGGGEKKKRETDERGRKEAFIYPLWGEGVGGGGGGGGGICRGQTHGCKRRSFPPCVVDTIATTLKHAPTHTHP